MSRPVLLLMFATSSFGSGALAMWHDLEWAVSVQYTPDFKDLAQREEYKYHIDSFKILIIY